ncbi:MAG: glycoside hydrolase family 28 protein [Candidatus Moraniibacteriota bacterium]
MFIGKTFFEENTRPATIFLKTPFADKLEIKQPFFNSKNCNIVDYGARVNDKDANTQAIARAIDDCSNAGGGKIIIPKGQWLTGPIKLKSNINLHVQKNAEILFSTELNDYLPVVFSRFEGIEYYNYSAPIYANDCTNLAITGEGKINGQAEKLWWELEESVSIKELYYMGRDNVPVSERIFGTPKARIRPSFVEFVNCDTILVKDVTLVNGPLWTAHFIYSKNITVKAITIDTGKEQDTDGIVLDSSSNALVEKANLTTGDDAIVIKSGRDQDGKRVNRPSENIVIKNCKVQKANAGVAIGSEISGGARNIFVQDLSIKKSDFAFRLKSAPGRGGIVENIWVDGISADRINIDAIQIDNFYEDPFKDDYRETTAFKNINLERISIKKTEGSIFIQGADEKFVENVSLKNIQINSDIEPKITNVNNITIDDLSITTTKNPTFRLGNVINAKITNYTCPDINKECFRISGEKSQAIEIKDTKLLENSIVFDGVDEKILSR